MTAVARGMHPTNRQLIQAASMGIVITAAKSTKGASTQNKSQRSP